MVIAHVIGKSENSGTKIDKSELDSEWETFLKLVTKIIKSRLNAPRISKKSQNLPQVKNGLAEQNCGSKQISFLY